MNKMAKSMKEQAEEVKKKFKGLSPVKIIILIIMIIGTICAYVFYDYIFGEKSVFKEPITDLGFINAIWGAIPKLIQAIQAVTVILVIATLIVIVVNKVLVKNQREITVANLIRSIIKWLTVIILIITVLAIWGVDTTALITGAGVITLIVGLGMQSLIADVVAGLFIVFENEFNVGDIITINDFRGEVVSIGIRTTKLVALGNVKIFNNSDIRGVLNQSADLSTAKTLIDIEYGESLDRVETIINEKLSGIEIVGKIGDISYDGVAALGASGVTLQFTCKCLENDIYGVGRELNKQLKLMFDENGINIPFNQLVVHSVDDDKKSDTHNKS